MGGIKKRGTFRKTEKVLAWMLTVMCLSAMTAYARSATVDK